MLPQLTQSKQADIEAMIRRAMKPDPLITVSEWADKNRILTTLEAAEPGRWRTARTPYLREPMDRLGVMDSTEIVVLMFGAQTGKTSVGQNWLGYAIENAPGPFLVVQPTLRPMGERYSKQRLDPMLKTTPSLRGLVKEPRARDSGNSVFSKSYPGGMIIIAGAENAGQLASMPLPYIHFDEVDRDSYAGSESGADEGDRIEIGIARTTTFKGKRKILITSTPLYKETSRVEHWYNRSDQRRYYVPCPHCGAMQCLKWAGIHWEKTSAGQDDPSTAYYQCESCGEHLHNHDKEYMLPRGEWRATAETMENIKGYHLSTLYAPHGWESWSDLVREFLAGRDNVAKLKSFINLRLGETWEEKYSATVDTISLSSHREGYNTATEIPDDIAVITVGVDVQGNRLEAEVVGWAGGFESWNIGYHVLFGDPIDPGLWADLDQMLSQVYTTTTGRTIPIAATCIDSGYSPGAVHDFCRPRQRRRIWAIKGDDREREVWRAAVSKSQKFNGIYHAVGVNAGKREVYGMLSKTEPGPGYCHFPLDRDEHYFDMLTSEKLIKKYDAHGRFRWLWHNPPGKRNEALDCRVYAYAALRGWLLGGGRLPSVNPARALPQPVKPAKPVVVTQPAKEIDRTEHKIENITRTVSRRRRPTWLT